MQYNNLSGYFRKKYGRRLGKICIDGGFSCPNRDGRCGVGGCIYCGERGAGEHIEPNASIKAQVVSALESAGNDQLFVAYFQNFTNTYAPIDILKERYDSALWDPRIKVLAIGTRPDCIDEEIAKLIASYKDRCDVWVELGLQTSSDRTAKIINRGYDRSVFENAMKILNKHGIPVVVHLIIGLPGEGEDEVIASAEYVASFKPFGVKIHSIYVMEGTALAEMFYRGEYTPLSQDEYVRLACEAIARMDPDTVMHRLTGDCPKEMLIAPDWNTDKHKTIDMISSHLSKSGFTQGSKFIK